MQRVVQGRIFTQVVGTCGDSSPALWFFFDHKRYLVNCGEAFQRFSLQHSCRTAKLESVFLTDLSWESFGGLPGLIMTLADSGSDHLHIAGPRHTSHLLEASRYFMARGKFKVNAQDYLCTATSAAPGPSYEDENLAVFPIILHTTAEPLFPEEYPKLNRDPSGAAKPGFLQAHRVAQRPKNSVVHRGPSSAAYCNYSGNLVVKADHQGRKGSPTRNRSRSPGCEPHFNLPKRFEATAPSTAVCCYAFHTPTIRGKFDQVKAEALGIKPGPKYSALTQGRSVENDAGEVIAPSDVIAPNVLGSVVLVIRCPSRDYLASLQASPAWEQYQNGGALAGQLASLYHMTPPATMATAEYQTWIDTFPEHVEHVSINEASPKRVNFRSAARGQEVLTSMDPDIFPPLFQTEGLRPPPMATPGGRQVQVGDILDLSELRPLDPVHKPFQWDLDANKERQVPSLTPPPPTRPVEDDTQRWDDTEVLFLGTGSAIPGKFRNVSCIHLSLEDGKHGILLDAGEGAMGQMLRVFGEAFEEKMVALKAIFITHMHADHHIGINRVIQHRAKLIRDHGLDAPPIKIFGPSLLQGWLDEYNTLFPTSFQFFPINEPSRVNKEIEELSLTLDAVPVIHCPNSYGFVFEHVSGWRLVYSGDTRPCDELVKRGQGATLLIHEATFEDGMEKEAIKKRHCTTGEAVAVGQNMNAAHVLLTHFSQRYPRVPVIKEQSTTAIAFDFMRVKFSWLPRIQNLLPTLRTFFAELADLRRKEKEAEEKRKLHAVKRRPTEHLCKPTSKKARSNPE